MHPPLTRNALASALANALATALTTATIALSLTSCKEATNPRYTQAPSAQTAPKAEAKADGTGAAIGETSEADSEPLAAQPAQPARRDLSGAASSPTAPAMEVAPPAPLADMAANGAPKENEVLLRASPVTALPEANNENYAKTVTTPIKLASAEPISTFSVDVDTGSYTNTRRMLQAGNLPPADAVRQEEFINYFDYALPVPAARKTPFSVTLEGMRAPWNAKHELVMIGLKGYEVPKSEIPPANLVFLLDVSGSMDEPNKLPLVKNSLRMLVNQLSARDRVSIVVYAGAAGAVLEPTPGDQKHKILAALDQLQAGGSTNGGQGIELAYHFAEANFIKGGVNRVILATDGDFNVGNFDPEALKTFVGKQRSSGISLSTMGFGDGNYNDEMTEQLADVGNGQHAYIDTLNEARKVLVGQLSGTLFTIASDVKVQVEFNPAVVSEYRLIGYENRRLANEDFNNDQVDAGDIGAGHSVTAIYEISRVGAGGDSLDPKRYAPAPAVSTEGSAKELGYVKLRYKAPGSSTSTLIQSAIASNLASSVASERLQFAASVAGFAELLRGSKYLNGYSFGDLATLARANKGADKSGDRSEFIKLVELAETLDGGKASVEISQ
jgi:Ca-activated chloride channel homolog